jgi:hypothetical protein
MTLAEWFEKYRDEHEFQFSIVDGKVVGKLVKKTP